MPSCLFGSCGIGLYISNVYVKGVDCTRNGVLISELKNDYAKGHYDYPADLIGYNFKEDDYIPDTNQGVVCEIPETNQGAPCNNNKNSIYRSK